jgi:hypothetical protein
MRAGVIQRAAAVATEASASRPLTHHGSGLSMTHRTQVLEAAQIAEKAASQARRRAQAENHGHCPPRTSRTQIW